MLLPHNTILIAVVSAAPVPPDERLLTHFMAPAETVEADVQLTLTCWHISTNGNLLANTHLLTTTLKSLLLPLRFERNVWIPSHQVRRTKAEAVGVVTNRLSWIWTGAGFQVQNFMFTGKLFINIEYRLTV